MEIPKAIEVLQDLDAQIAKKHHESAHQAVKLGIEALKVWQAITNRYPRIAKEFLPGETEDCIPVPFQPDP